MDQIAKNGQRILGAVYTVTMLLVIYFLVAHHMGWT